MTAEGRPEDRRRHLPRLARRPRRRCAPSGPPAPRRSPSGTPTGPARRRRGDPARRLLLRRLPALRRHRPLRPGDGGAGPRRPRRPAGPGDLQRVPDPLRVPPAARRADPQRPPQVHLHRAGPPRRERLHRLDLRPRGRQPHHHPPEERRGRVRRRRADPRAARGRGPDRLPVRRGQPQRLLPRHRRHHQRARQRGRADAAPRARRRGGVRAVHRRARVLHLRPEAWSA